MEQVLWLHAIFLLLRSGLGSQHGRLGKDESPLEYVMKVLHCPTHISGQMWEYAQGLRALGVEANVLTFAKHPFGYPDDLCLNLPLEPVIWRRRWKLVRNFLDVVRRYDVIHFHFGGTLLPRYLDLPLLRLLGKKMIMHYYGSDVRLKAIAEANNPYFCMTGDYLLELGNDDEKTKRLRQVARHIKVAIAADYELHSYVSPFFKRVVSIPQAIDTRELKPAFPDAHKGIPLIVHSPSNKAIKGTQYVEEVVSRLKKRYHFEFLLLHQMTNHEVKEAFKKADIIVDQLLLGTYGIASVEAMALGKPVLCYIRDDLVSKYPEDLPIINANPDTIELELEKLLLNPQLRTKIGKRSRRFVERYHDSRVVAQKLIELYQSL